MVRLDTATKSIKKDSDSLMHKKYFFTRIIIYVIINLCTKGNII